ncbi:MAG: hypothetical protein AAFQ14_12200 [Cyanobacteria bacterium J06621_12]
MNNATQDKLLISQLRSSWFDLLQQLQADTNLGEAIFTDLVKAYSNPGRLYHNLDHIQHTLTTLTEAQELITNFPALQLCAWFHDYVYVPQALDNEVQSAVYAERTLAKLKIDFDTIRLVQQIILSTRKHEPLLEATDNLVFLDVDLAILGSPVEKYQAYSQAIRKEYQSVSDRDYQEGRRQILSQFLARNKIYYTDYFYQRLESSARENLQAEINHLEAI